MMLTKIYEAGVFPPLEVSYVKQHSTKPFKTYLLSSWSLVFTTQRGLDNVDVTIPRRQENSIRKCTIRGLLHVTKMET